MTPEDQLDPPVHPQEVGACLQILYPDVFNRIVAVLKGAKRSVLIPEADEPDEVD